MSERARRLEIALARLTEASEELVKELADPDIPITKETFDRWERYEAWAKEARFVLGMKESP